MKLNNGYEIPAPGFGTFKTPDGEVCVNAVREAIATGYIHIDTAAVYGNECSVGQGVRESGVPREKLFITSKLWNTERGYDTTLRACEKTLQDLGMDYLDLYLIHWPANELQFGSRAAAINVDTWRAMERLADEKVVRSVGLSNFYPSHIAPVLVSANIVPAVDQIEYHPGLLQEDTIALCREKGILVEAWSPLGRGKSLEHPLLKDLAEKYDRTVAQIILRWEMQHNVVPLPKSVNPERIRSNSELFDFELSEDDMEMIDEIEPYGNSGHSPDQA